MRKSHGKPCNLRSPFSVFERRWKHADKMRRLGNFFFLLSCFIHSSFGTWNCEEIGSLTSWAQLSASSQKVLQKRQNLVLWSPQDSIDDNPYLQFNFDEFVEVWELQVQSKTLMEFKLQFSEKSEDQDFRDLKEGKYGLPKVFFMHGEAQKLFSVDPSPVFAKVILMRKVNPILEKFLTRRRQRHFGLELSYLFTSLTER